MYCLIQIVSVFTNSNGPLAIGIDQASLRNENGNKCLQTNPSEETDNNFEPTDKQNFDCAITTPPTVSPDDQKMYQDLLVSFVCSI